MSAKQDCNTTLGQRAVVLLMLGLLGVSGCGSLLPNAPIQPTLYILDGSPASSSTTTNRPSAPATESASSAPTLTVSTPIAAAGFSGTHIVYQRNRHELERFALNQWVETPVQMLAPLIVRALEGTGSFRSVVRGSTAAMSDFRLDTELVRLQQEFTSSPSRTRLTVRAVLVNTSTRRVVAAREFDASVAAPSEDPRGGVVAANEVVNQVLAELAKFCAESVKR
jgi:cholesterol transport system auxiliary component